MAEHGFLSDLLQRIAQTARLARNDQDAGKGNLTTVARELLNETGEATAMAISSALLDRYEAMTPAKRADFLKEVAVGFGVDQTRLADAIAAWTPGDDLAARAIHFTAEPESQELIRRLNCLPGATARLVAMRADLLTTGSKEPAIKALDQDFLHLFSSWFNRGFLEIRRIDWSTPAAILEKVIAYEAVHEIADWEDLRRRVADPDRRLFAFFHPAMPVDPLIFVEVALTRAIPKAIAPILAQGRERVNPHDATTAVFYSISNCHLGLKGISFGNFLIKQVVTELNREMPGLKTFVTLSPVPGLRKWVEDEMASGRLQLSAEDAAALADAPPPALARRIAALYLTGAHRSGGRAFDPVAHFHLGNGASLHAIHADADLSPRGRVSSWGVMVNYLYDSATIEDNHQAYATKHTITISTEVRKLADIARANKAKAAP